MVDYTIKETDYVDANHVANWSNINTGVISYNAGLADTEANWERSFACYQIACAANGDGAQIVYANWQAGGFAPIATSPTRGYWIRCDDATAILTISDVMTDLSTVSTSMSVTTANKWQYVEADLTSVIGKTASSFQITANKACNIWICRINWVNQSRILSGAQPAAGTYSDERWQFTANTTFTNAITVERCCITSANSTGVYGNYNINYKGNFIYTGGLGFTYTGYITNWTASLSINLFTGTMNQWWNINMPWLGFSAGGLCDNNYLFGSGNTISWGSGATPVVYGDWNNNYFYGSGNSFVNAYNGILSLVGGKWVSCNRISGSGGQNFIKFTRTTFSVVNPMTYFYAGGAGNKENYIIINDGDPTIGLFSLPDNNNIPAEVKKRNYFTTINFVTNPVVSGLLVIGYPTITDNYTYPSRFKDVTDGSGKTSAACLVYEQGYRTQLDKDWSTADPNGWVFYFINTSTNLVLARYPSSNTIDISSGIGTPVSPVTVNLSAAPVISSITISPLSGVATDKDAITITATILNTPTNVYAVLTDGTYYKVKEMFLVSGTTYQIVLPPGWTWIKTYTTSQLYVQAMNATGWATGNLGANYTVVEGDGTDAADIMFDKQQLRKQLQSQVVTIQN